MASLIIKPRSRLFHGHQWVYASDVANASGNPQPGDTVVLKDFKNRVLGSAIYNPKSQIIARRYSFRATELDRQFFSGRLDRAIELRNNLPINQKLTRLVWSESDGVPGLIVDRYGDHLSVQTLTLAMGQREDIILDVLKEKLSPASITMRNDANVRAIEGLPVEKKTVFGTTPPPFSVNHEGITLQIDIMEGQKTGLYLDQLDNYLAVAKRAKGRRVLDCFSNQGGFAQACAVAGASEVSALDVSGPALAQARANAEASGLRMQTIEANAFDWLKAAEQREEKFDLIILDPPSFSRSKGTVNDALRGYKEIHLRAVKMLTPGGVLSTFSCSHHISLGEFYKTILDAAVDAKRTLRLVERHGQRLDHPIIAGIPETEYLRGYTFELVPGW